MDPHIKDTQIYTSLLFNTSPGNHSITFFSILSSQYHPNHILEKFNTLSSIFKSSWFSTNPFHCCDISLSSVTCYNGGLSVILTPSVLGCIFIFILLIVCWFLTASETHVEIKVVQTQTINLLTSIDPSQIKSSNQIQNLW